MKTLRTVVLPIVGGLLVGGWLFLKWDAHRVKQVQLHLLLERTGLTLPAPYQITEYEYEGDWDDFEYRFNIRLPTDALPGNFATTQASWGTWKREGGKYEFQCTHAKCYSDRIFAHYDPRTRELTLHQIHL